MEKEHIIAFIEEQIAAGKISRADLAELGRGSTFPAQGNLSASAHAKEDSSKNLINALYAIGAIIAIIGAGILVGEHWEEIGFAGRILATFGIALTSYVFALLLRKPEQRTISQVLFVIAAALSPLGMFVLFQESGVAYSLNIQIGIALGLFAVFLLAYLIARKNILILLSIGFATWAYYSVIFQYLQSAAFANDSLQWVTMLLGASYILIGYGYHDAAKALDAADAKEKKSIVGVLYGVGALAVLGSGIAVGGSFDILYILVLFAAFYGSVYLRNRAMLVLGSLFLVAHIGKLTSKYFAGSVGWPVALIIVGFLTIGIGYLTFYLNRKFIAANR